ncbi:LPS export ABC transporter permease LptF [Cognatishimia sp. SS12]|uniref:LPS export ABC transporter permease LptF n=1 Tax=Cognatishimia sp. SS12 TaxID=2979465 RepID=UPI0023310654|nr:LPS export ABC transporter permease LptF [Cognatishimia sp. SS12]MDC0737304.1 LPS export ABC transporter permease LptF [Cognatishimia sp. SS12]
MNRFDRYMLSQLMMLFGFFALVLVSVYWVNRAVVLFDRLIADGQSIGVFLEFTMLSLPNVIKLILPIASFAAATYVTNRLSSESELVVMQATGFSPWRLARPILNFGIIAGLMMAALTIVLVPTSLTQLDQREREIAENATARLLSEGTFLHPSGNITFYIRDISSDGVLHDLFLSDRSNPKQTITYTAEEAYLIKSDAGPKLVMVDGLAQVENTEDGRLFTTNFADFAYDISSFLQYRNNQQKSLERTGTLDLIRVPEDIALKLDLPLGWVMAELHGRFAQIGMVIVAALVGFSTLLLGGFSRFGVWQQIVLAFAILVALEAMKNGVSDPVRRNAELWYLMYVPSVIGLALVVLMLASRAYPISLRKRGTS